MKNMTDEERTFNALKRVPFERLEWLVQEHIRKTPGAVSLAELITICNENGWNYLNYASQQD